MHAIHEDSTHIDIQKYQTGVDVRNLGVMDSLPYISRWEYIFIKPNEWIGHLIKSINCDVTGHLWRHEIYHAQCGISRC